MPVDRQNVTIIERAFELARSGKCRNVSDLRVLLRAEGWVDSGQLRGSTIVKQLHNLISTSNHDAAVSREAKEKNLL